MATLLSFILLTQFFTFAQEQVTPPVQILEVEVFAREFKGTNPRDPRLNQSPPPGPVSAQSIPGVRPSKESLEKPKIEDRSSELRRVGSQGRSQQSAPLRFPGGFTFEYRVKVKNTSPKKIKAILWEYQLLDSSAAEIVARRVFLCGASVKSSSEKVLQAVLFSPPARVVSADASEETQKHRVLVHRIDYSDKSTWVRDGWKQEGVTRPDAIPYGRKLDDGACLLL